MYIYIERESEREREGFTDLFIYLSIYLFIYSFIYLFIYLLSSYLFIVYLFLFSSYPINYVLMPSWVANNEQSSCGCGMMMDDVGMGWIKIGYLNNRMVSTKKKTVVPQVLNFDPYPYSPATKSRRDCPTPSGDPK